METGGSKWLYQGHEIIVGLYGNFSVIGDGETYETLEKAKARVDRLVDHQNAAKKLPVSLAALTEDGDPILITGLRSGNGDLLPHVKYHEARYVNHPKVLAILDELKALNRRRDALEAALLKTSLTQGYQQYRNEPNTYANAIELLKTNYAKALAAAEALVLHGVS